ncbi:hypothetical protein D3C81_774650 [compost metagenome]
MSGDRRCDGCENADWREGHDEVSDLEHHLGQLFDAIDNRCVTRSLHTRQGKPEEQREHHDLQDFVVGHCFSNAAGKHVTDENLEAEIPGVHHGARRMLDDLHVQSCAGLEQVHQAHADCQRYHRSGYEPGHGSQAYAPNGARVSHAGNAADQGGEHQRSDDHLDHA